MIGQWSTGINESYKTNIRTDIVVGNDATVTDDIIIGGNIEGNCLELEPQTSNPAETYTNTTIYYDSTYSVLNLGLEEILTTAKTSIKQIPFNDDGVWAGNANLIFDKSTNSFSCPNLITSNISTGGGILTFNDGFDTLTLEELYNGSDGTILNVQISNGSGGFTSSPGIVFDSTLDSSGRLSVSGAILSPIHYIGNTNIKIENGTSNAMIFTDGLNTSGLSLSDLNVNYPSNGVQYLVQISDGSGNFSSDSDCKIQSGILQSNSLRTLDKHYFGTDATVFVRRNLDKLEFYDTTTGYKTLENLAETYTPPSGTSGQIPLYDSSSENYVYDTSFSYNSTSNILTAGDKLNFGGTEYISKTGTDLVFYSPDVGSEISLNTLYTAAGYSSDGIAGRVQLSDGSSGFTSDTLLRYVSNSLFTPTVISQKFRGESSSSGLTIAFNSNYDFKLENFETTPAVYLEIDNHTNDLISLKSLNVEVENDLKVSGKLSIDANEIDPLETENFRLLAWQGDSTETTTYKQIATPLDLDTTASSANLRLSSLSSGEIFVESSSRRYKQDIEKVNFGADILSLEPVIFKYKSDVKKLGDDAEFASGLIAEDAFLSNSNFIKTRAYDEIPENGLVKDEMTNGKKRVVNDLDDRAILAGIISLCKSQQTDIETLKYNFEVLQADHEALLKRINNTLK